MVGNVYIPKNGNESNKNVKFPGNFFIMRYHFAEKSKFITVPNTGQRNL